MGVFVQSHVKDLQHDELFSCFCSFVSVEETHSKLQQTMLLLDGIKMQYGFSTRGNAFSDIPEEILDLLEEVGVHR